MSGGSTAGMRPSPRGVASPSRTPLQTALSNLSRSEAALGADHAGDDLRRRRGDRHALDRRRRRAAGPGDDRAHGPAQRAGARQVDRRTTSWRRSARSRSASRCATPQAILEAVPGVCRWSRASRGRDLQDHGRGRHDRGQGLRRHPRQAELANLQPRREAVSSTRSTSAHTPRSR